MKTDEETGEKYACVVGYSDKISLQANILEKYKNYEVKEIADYAFNKYVSVRSIEIPNGVENIGDHVFACESLETIYCESESKPATRDMQWSFIETGELEKEANIIWGYEGLNK